MLKQHLQLKLKQQVVITAKLQQSVRLLQLSASALRQEIQQALETNPLLELIDPNEEPDGIDSDARLTPEQIEYDVKLPEFTATYASPPRNSTAYIDHIAAANDQSLQDYLLWQAALSSFSPSEHAIAVVIIDNIDTRGYLDQSLNDIAETIDDPAISVDMISHVLHQIQHFDPLGVGARDLKECLLIQLSECNIAHPLFLATNTLIKHHLASVASGDLTLLHKLTHYPISVIKSAILIIKQLHPIPGTQINDEPTDYIMPDLFVRKIDKQWRVFLNQHSLPSLRINQHYVALSQSLTNAVEQQFIHAHLQEANWLIKSLKKRNETLLNVTKQVIKHQQSFFDIGESALKPMILSDIADVLNLHASTVSRAITGKYIQSTKGTIELKYFFSNPISTEFGQTVSSRMIKSQIKKLIHNEDPKKPLSDSKITLLFKKQGIIIARRTVAKYREMSHISASHCRKK